MTVRLGINPVTLKELRQMVRSRMVAVGLIVYLLAQLGGVSLVLMSSADDGSGGSLYGRALGQSVFHMVYFLLSFLLLLCLPLFMGTRIGLERGKEHLDLQYITALKPQQFVDGKVASAVVMTVVFASASLPFLVLSYLLRGVDLFSVLWMFCGLLLITVCSLYGTLFLGALGVSRTLRLFLLLGVIFALLLLLGTVNIGGAGVMSSGVGELFDSWQEVLGWLSALGLAIWGCALCRAVTVAALSPPHANRALPVRRGVTACWLFWALVALLTALETRESTPLYIWAFMSVLVSAGLLAVSASMPPGYSRRVLSSVSPRLPARVAQYFFYSGAESGMAWALALGFLSVLAILLVGAFTPWLANDSSLTSAQLVAIFLYLTAIICSARAAWCYALQRVVTPKLVGVAAAVMVLLGSTLPYLLTLDSGGGGDEHAARWFGNVAAVFDRDMTDLGFHLICSSAWALLAWSVCMPLIFGAFRQFRRPACAASDIGGAEV
jgi:hypothetical protein